MITFKSYLDERYSFDKISPKYYGLPDEILRKRSKDNRKYSPAERREMENEILNRQSNESVNEEAPAMNTAAVPGAGSDNTLHMKKMRMFKEIIRRHKIPQEYLK